MWKHVPNCITALRIVGMLVLLFLRDPFSLPFLIVYGVSGVTDALDGFIARATHSSSKLGAVLDSVADLLLYAVMLIKFFPYMFLEGLPEWIWFVTAGVMLIRIASYTVAAVKYHRFASQHTYLNKLTGFVMFLVPFMLKTPIEDGYCLAVCIMTGISSLEELLIHATQKEYIPEQKSIFYKRKKADN